MNVLVKTGFTLCAFTPEKHKLFCCAISIGEGLRNESLLLPKRRINLIDKK